MCSVSAQCLLLQLALLRTRYVIEYNKCIVIGKPEGKSPRQRSRRRWEHNINIYLKGIGFEGMDWIHMAQDSCEHGNESLGSMKSG
jgi:hypothetical protein